MKRLCVALALCGAPAWSDGLDLTPAARAAFGTEVRRALLADPQIIARALAPPDPYADEKSADLALIAAHGVALFGAWPAPRAIAFFTAPDCADCARAAEELDTAAAGAGWRVTRHAADGDLARSLGVPNVPFYVLPDLMIRGWMPKPALMRYLQ